MGQITIYKNNYMDSTVVSNLFIDEYMKDANDAQLKVYIYLLRVMNSNAATSISDMADLFNHTEKDIIRALTYWEKHHLLSLEYDSNKNIIGIHMEEPTGKQAGEIIPLAPVVSMSKTAETTYPIENIAVQEAVIPQKPSYSLDEIKLFKEKESTEQLIFIMEQYLQKPLSVADINTILFLSDKLHFSDDLIDYLVQYCVDRGKKDFRYIEKVAISWAENHVTTPQEAEKYAHKYDKTIYSIMNALGKSNSPSPKEVEFIKRWTDEYGFETDVIFEACERTVLATENHRFEYADKILSSWKNAEVHHKADIQKIDELYQKKKNATAFANKQPANNKFNQFKQHDYDFDAIERAILSQ
ncbi:MAG: DnaD domain protein [Lachnospiraceae bacterium]|nr:DnaD domain protein [Lachnospiraceae bacterium]